MLLMKSGKKFPMLPDNLFQLKKFLMKVLLLKLFGNFLMKFERCLTEFEK